MPDLDLHLAGLDDHDLVDRLWLMSAHDLSEHRAELPRADGSFRDERLRAALSEADRCAWVLRLGDRPVGLALVRAIETSPRVLTSFFIVRGARRRGLGRAGVAAVLEQHPGAWEVAYQRSNAGAAAFWPAVATWLDPHGWRQELRAVPDRPDLPADAWVALSWPPAPDPGAR